MSASHCEAFVGSLPVQTTSYLSRFTSRSVSQLDTPFKPRAPRRYQNIVCIEKFRRGRKPDPQIPESLFHAKPIADIDFKQFDFSTLDGKVVLVSNVATNDDYTESNYKMFTNLLESYHAAGFEVLAFPSNWFGQKEPGTPEEIKKFVYSNYSNKIKLFSKTDIDWNQVFALGTKHFPGDIIWNFHGKFLFDRTGMPVARFDLLSTAEDIDSAVNRVMYGRPKNDELSLEVPKPEEATS